MTSAELRELVEAALAAKNAREHARETSTRLMNGPDPDMSKHDLAIAAAVVSDEAQHRLDVMLDAYAKQKRETGA